MLGTQVTLGEGREMQITVKMGVLAIPISERPGPRTDLELCRARGTKTKGSHKWENLQAQKASRVSGSEAKRLRSSWRD